MNTCKPLLTLAIAGILGSSSLILGSNAFAETKTVTDKAASETLVAASSDADESSHIKTVDEAYKALHEIRGARMAIFNGQPEEAVKLTGEAHTNLVAAKDTMHEHELMTQKKADKSDAYIPFDISMQFAEGFVPDEAKKAALIKANEHLAKGEKAHAIEALKLVNIDVAVTASLLPAASSLQHVNDAVKLLSEKKYYEANLALKAVEDSVLVETYDINAVASQGSATKG